MIKMFVISVVSLVLIGCGGDKWIVTEDTLTDPDGNTYTTVRIGNQIWTVENLRTTKYACGTRIPHVTNKDEWSKLSTPAYCWYDNTSDTEFREKYGALYNWFVVNPSNQYSIAPKGWRVPTNEDWKTLQNHLIKNGYNWDGTTEGNKIGKALASNGGEWREDDNAGCIGNNQDSNNSSGFSALPGGYRYYYGHFYHVGYYGTWWSATENNASHAWHRNLGHYNEYLGWHSYVKGWGFSVRLLRDN